MLNLRLIFFSEKIKTQTVFFRIDQVDQSRTDQFQLRTIQQTFKDRILYTLAIILTLLRNLTQSLSSGRI